jgi:DNA-binding GntR family transcriptional regulator
VTHGGEQAYRQWLHKDRAFHRLIVETAGNSLLNELYERLAVFLQIARVRLSQLGPSTAKGHEEHKIIVKAYEARDRDSLIQALGSHLGRSRNEILEVARGRSIDKPV